MLMVQDLHAFYGKSHVLHGVNLQVNAGEVLALLGRNGSGRSTTAKAIMGLVSSRGLVQWRGHDLAALAPHARAQRGLGYVPENRDVFASLTVEHNLLLGQKSTRGRGHAAARWSFQDMYDLFPSLQARAHVAAGVLSGGEQQMLTLCRTLMGDPDLVLIDEPTEGLAPQLVEQVARFLSVLRERGVAVLLIEQKLPMALGLADRCLVMGHGRVVFEGTPQALRQADDVRKAWLEV